MMFFRRAAARALSTSSRQICAPCRPQPTALLTSSLRLSASRPSTLVLFQKRCNSSAFSDAHDESPGAETTSSEASSGSVFEEMSESDGTEASQEGMTGRIHRLRGDTGRGASRNEPPPDPNPSVYIGNLYFSISELDLEKQMSKFGPLKHIKLLYDARGMSRGIAFANFETTEAAGRAVREMNGRFFEGRPVSVQYARNQEQRDVPKAARHPPSSTLFVGNLSYELTDKDLNDLFATIPNCTDVRVAIDRRTGQPRGFAHADFTDVESAVSAQEELNGKIMFGRRLRVDYTKRKDQMNEAPDHPEGESSEQLMGASIQQLPSFNVHVCNDRTQQFTSSTNIIITSSAISMSLLGGAECSTASNPLSQFSKHVHDDRSQYLERLTGSRADGGSQSIRDKAPVGGQDAMLEGFLQSPDRSLSNPVTALPATFDQIRQELSNLPLSSDPRVGASTEWTAEFNRSDIGAERGMEMGWEAAASAQLDLSAAESVPFDQLASSQRTYTATSISSAPTMAQQSQQQRPLGRPMMGSWLSPLNMGTYSSTMTSPLRAGMTARPMEGKGKGRLVELDDDKWEAQFAQVDDAQRQDHDRDATARAAMAQELEEMDRVGTNDTSDLDGLWRGIHAETGRQLDELLRGEDIGMNIKANEMGDMYLTNEDMQGLRIHDGFSTDPDMGEYIFEEDNPFQDMADPFAEGMRIMEEGGNLSLAALAFEAVVRKDPEHVQAWTMLGNAQAQNEKESPAIRALERALRLDPTNLSALMGLAVSYTNEGYDMSAYRTLERWLATKYPDIVQAAVPPKPAEDIDMMFSGRVQFATHLRSMFIQAAQLSPAGEAMDPDVQVGLGVLFYGAEEHDKAVDCFSAALASTETGTSNGRTQRHLLWNRLGATLANSGRSEEAIAAYEEALRLRPNFVRARYNLGVSCINIGVLEAAAQHLLGALAMHKIMVKDGMERRRGLVQGGLGNVENTIPEGDGIYGSLNPSTNLFDTLRRVFVQMGRSDMAGLVGPSIDLDMFRKDFDF